MSGTDGRISQVPYPEVFNELATGESTLERTDETSGNQSMGASGTLRLSYFTARKTEITTQVRQSTGQTAAAATPTLCRIGLYTVAANGDLALVASIANDTTLFATINTAYTRAWTVAYQKTAGQRLALGILVISAAAMPVMMGSSVPDAAELALAPRLTGAVGGQADLPANIATGAVGTSGSRIYTAILP